MIITIIIDNISFYGTYLLFLLALLNLCYREDVSGYSGSAFSNSE